MFRKSLAATAAGAAGLALMLSVSGASTAQDEGRPPARGAEKGKGEGPPGGGPGGPGMFGPGMMIAPRVLELADANKDGKVSPEEAGKAAEKFVRDAGAASKGAVDATTLGRALNKKLGPPPGFGPEDDDGPADFGPGTFLAPQILGAADSDKDGKLSPEEAGKAAEKFIGDADAARSGGIDRDGLADSINRRIGPPPGFGGPGGPMGAERKLVEQFDKDRDGRLNLEERKAAREFLKKQPRGGGPGGRPGFGPPGGMGSRDEPGKPGPRVDPSQVEKVTGKPLYDPTTVRTFFLDFEDKDWEAEMADFYRSDVEIPARLTVDGKTYPGVGVHFRGLSSFFTVREGSKRSLNVSLDFTDPKQRLGGYKTLNLLNSHEDPTFLHTILYFQIARQYIPAPKANYAKVVINGESWGVYINAQQFDKTFLAENYPSADGTRWKVKGSPGGGGGLEYTGENIEDYKRRFDIKSGDNPRAWRALMNLCKTLNRTPIEDLEAALKPMLDVEGVLWFLALDNALINNDGYWVRASDYSLFLDPKGIFHVIPHDANETFGSAMMMGFGPGGPGGRRGGPGGGPGGPPGGGPGGGLGGPPGGGPGPGGGRGPARFDLDPLIGMNDATKPLRSRLLAVPTLRARYLDHVRTIARDWLDWEKLGPVVAQYRSLIARELEADTRKLNSFSSYEKAVADAPAAADTPRAGGPGGVTLRAFADGRRKFLLDHPEIKKSAP